jgi:hypothetical protein
VASIFTSNNNTNSEKVQADLKNPEMLIEKKTQPGAIKGKTPYEAMRSLLEYLRYCSRGHEILHPGLMLGCPSFCVGFPPGECLIYC